MTNKNHKINITLLALVLAGVVSLPFLILRELTALYLIAYGLALAAIAALWLSNIRLTDDIKSYPWGIALPAAVGKYSIAQIALSLPFVLLDQFSLFSVRIVWFILLHALLFAVFALYFITLRSGKALIDQSRAEIQEKTMFIQSLRADLSDVLEKVPEAAGSLQPVLDAVRYSDPMSQAPLLPYENDIKDSTARLQLAAGKKDAEEISSLCVTLLRQIKDRNNRVRALK